MEPKAFLIELMKTTHLKITPWFMFFTALEISTSEMLYVITQTMLACQLLRKVVFFKYPTEEYV